MADTQDKWAQRITAAGAVVTPVLTLIVLYYQSQLSKTTESAAEHAKAAATEVQTKSKELKSTLDELSEKQDADLQSWKAYHTKEPEDMNKAHEAIARVENKAAAQAPPPPNP